MKLSVWIRIFLGFWLIRNSISISAYFTDVEWQQVFREYSVLFKALTVLSFLISLGFVILTLEAQKFRESTRRAILALIYIDLLHLIIGVPIYLTHYGMTQVQWTDLVISVGWLMMCWWILTRPKVKGLFRAD